MDTKTKILDAAETLTKTRGINGFSYLHLASELGIKTSSIHYHFKTKADLAEALVERIHETHRQSFDELNASIADPRQRLGELVAFFQDYVRREEFCMCGMMSAEMQFVSEATHASLRRYFQTLENWVAAQLKEMGQPQPSEGALRFVSALEGSLLLARLHDDPDLVRRALSGLIA